VSLALCSRIQAPASIALRGGVLRSSSSGERGKHGLIISDGEGGVVGGRGAAEQAHAREAERLPGVAGPAHELHVLPCLVGYPLREFICAQNKI
jgi:hypothetical protein